MTKGLRFLFFILIGWISVLLFYREADLEYTPTQSQTYLKTYLFTFLIPSSQVAIISQESNSMYPAVKNKDICIMINYPFDKLEVGDVVSIQYPDCQVLHRLIRKTNLGWVTKGDNNHYEDDVILYRYNYRGKMFVNLKL